MRHQLSATVAAAVALAFATAAYSATVTSPGAVTVSSQGATSAQQGTFVSNAPGRPNGTPTKPAAVTSTEADRKPTNFSDVDARDQETRAATAATRSSGSSSATANLGTNAATGTTSGTTTTGTTGGTTAGSTTGNNTSGTTTGSTTGRTTFGGALVTAPIFGNPDIAFANPDVANGLAAPNTFSANQGVTASDILAGSSVADTTVVAQNNGVNVDRAIAQVSRDRRRVGRNGQLLYSIAPRTNADRSNEMRDDPLPPALTGSNSTLTR